MAIIAAGCSPQVDFKFLDGKSASLGDFEGQWLVVNFWAEWCAPCLEEIPDLNELHQEGVAHDIVVLGVSYDRISNAKLKQIVTKIGIDYPVMATDPIPILPFALPASLPTNYILDPRGEIALKLVGTQSKEKLLQSLAVAKKAYKN